MPSVSGQRILVTGAASGVGREVATLLADKGAKLVLWDMDRSGLDSTVELVKEHGGEAEMAVVNLAEPKSIADAASQTAPVWGVVSNAGIVSPTLFLETSDERNELTYRVNTFAQQYLAKHFLPHMIKQNSGVFVSLTSAASYIGAPRMSTYAASKAAARVFIESLAQEVAAVAPNVHLAVVCPGAIDTKLFKGFGTNPLAPVLKASDVARSIVDNAIERSSPCQVLPKGAAVGVLMKGILPERLWRTFVWRDLKDTMKAHDANQSDTAFQRMQQSKL